MALIHPEHRLQLTVLASGHGWHVQDLHRAAEKVGVGLQTALFQDLHLDISSDGSAFEEKIYAGPHRLDDQAAVLVRMMPPGGLERVVFRMDALHRLQERGVPVFNPPRTVEMAVDKALSLARLAAAGVPVPRTWVGELPQDAVIAFERLGGDVVCKPIFGSEGRGLVRLQHKELAWRVAHGLAQTSTVIYFQEFMENDGSDLRVMVLDGQILAAMRRTASPLDWRTNVAQGARAEMLRDVPHAVAELALKVAKIMGGIILGVDVMQSRTDGRWRVLEVNAVPGWRALNAVTGVDIAAEWLWAVQRGLK